MTSAIEPPDNQILKVAYEKLKKDVGCESFEGVESKIFPQHVNVDEVDSAYRVRREVLPADDFRRRRFDFFLKLLSLMDRDVKYHWVKIVSADGPTNVLVDSENRYAAHISLKPDA